MWVYNRPNELRHYGVLGMHWGTKRGTSKYVKKENIKKSEEDWDEMRYGKRGQQRIKKRIESGQSAKIARGKEFATQFALGLGVTAVLKDLQSGGELHRSVGKAFVKARANSIIYQVLDKSGNVILNKYK